MNIGKFLITVVVGCSCTSCAIVVSLSSAGRDTAEQGGEQIVEQSSGTKSVVTPDGKHITLHKGGNTTTAISSDGKVSTYYNSGNGNGVIVNPDCKISTYYNHGNGSGVIVNPDGSHTIVHK